MTGPRTTEDRGTTDDAPSVTEYSARHPAGRRTTLSEASRPARADRGTRWLRLRGADSGAVEAAAAQLGAPTALLRRASHGHRRPGVQHAGDTYGLALRVCRIEGAGPRGRIRDAGSVLFVVAAEDTLVTLEDEAGDALGAGAKAVAEDSARWTRGGAGGVLRTLVDGIAESWLDAVAALEEAVDEVDPEDDVPGRSQKSRARPRDNDTTARRIHHLRRQVLRLRRAVAPAALALRRNGNDGDEGDEVAALWRETADLLRHSLARLDTLLQLLDSAHDARMAEIGVAQNNDMRRISSVAALIAVPTMVAGNYGMNFDQMPELAWRFGYPLVVGVTFTVCAGLWIHLRRRGWL
ncbi:CorA family divalent cation transporter [Kitasatospora herbaricolor]|uniref:Magnesium transporter n=1 Tax=Kitasatospora herbaricolor TaxID=68217 RepID=A0ABZ1W2B9_9ACTN|nr:CorA family divalent cation transporter [Kitasatospora herbaricolor]